MMINLCNPPLLFLVLNLFLIANTNNASNYSTSVEIPTRIIAGYPNSPGQFMASIRVGSPPQEFMLVADTGSDQTWINCNYTCAHCPERKVGMNGERLFQARSSSSLKVIPCLSEFCKTVTFQNGCLGSKTPETPCEYETRYGDGSTIRGIYMNETVTIGGRHRTLGNVLVGCTSSVGGDLGGANGLLGLGSTAHSFTTKAAKKFGNKFSYCWTDILKPNNNLKTYLNFGKPTPPTLLPKMQYTNLDLEQPPYYAVNISGLSVNGMLLNISSGNWDFSTRQGGVVMDSGLSLTVLSPSAYEPVMATLKTALAKFNVVESSFYWGGATLSHCFNSTGFHKSMVPKLAFHFVDGARFVPPVRNYVVEVEAGVRCLAFYNANRIGIPFNILGSIMQQGFHWEYDLAAKKLGFARSTCVNR